MIKVKSDMPLGSGGKGMLSTPFNKSDFVAWAFKAKGVININKRKKNGR
ncbi:hypothetical protein AAFN85_24225 [Mucilaginibacter sp. CAU 1740]